MSILQKIDPALTDCQALVLAPTRELAQQIVKVVRALGDYMQLNVSRSIPSIITPKTRTSDVKWGVACFVSGGGKGGVGSVNSLDKGRF